MTSRGKFVVLEGTDGSGTTTQCALLIQALAGLGVRAHPTREPTAGPVGQLLRAALEKRLKRDDGEGVCLDWTTMALLFAADRTDHVIREIAPALSSGAWVISDRYDLSSLIYQSLTAPEPTQALGWVRQLNARALRPDLVLVLDVDDAIASGRRLSRGGAEELFEYQELQAKLATAYLRAEDYAPGDVIVHVDGNRPQQEVAASILDVVRARLMA